jgi:hypothetical protein
MKKITSILLMAFLSVHVIVLSSSCSSSSPSQIPTSVSSTSALETAPLSPTAPTTSLTFEQAKEQLKEKGWAVVNAAEEASQIVGYPVAVPTFVPEGFSPIIISNSGTLFIQILGFGLPTSVPRTHKYPFVQQTFSRGFGMPSPDEPFFQINQSLDQITISGEAIDIAGITGMKSIIPGNTTRLELGWTDGSKYYSLMGTLVNPLDETILVKIAASLAVNSK